MKLLDEIIDGSADPKYDLTSLLRKALVLGSVLKNASLTSWARSELDGYREMPEVPGYRDIKAHARGDFRGYSEIVRGLPIPPHLMDESHRAWATSHQLRQGIPAYEELLRSDDNPVVEWPGDLILYYQGRFVDGAFLMRAYQTISRSAIIDLVGTVRNRLLTLALDLRDGLEVDDPKDAVPERVQEAVIHNIFGGNVVIAASISGKIEQTGTKTVVKGDLASLRSALQGAGISKGEIGDLESAIVADGEDGPTTGIGKWVALWLKERSQTLGDGVAAGVVTQHILRYLGIL